MLCSFDESIDFILEPDKTRMHKGDSRLMRCIFLGHEWRSTEYLVGNADSIFKCRTVRRRAAEVAYDPGCVDFLTIPYDEYVLRGAKTTVSVIFDGPKIPEAAGPVPFRGREFVPRRVYTKIGDSDTLMGSRMGARDAHGIGINWDLE